MNQLELFRDEPFVLTQPLPAQPSTQTWECLACGELQNTTICPNCNTRDPATE